MPEERLTEAAHQLRGARGGIWWRVHGAQGAGDQLKGRLHFRPIVGRGEELTAGDDGAYHRTDIAMGAEKGVRPTRDQRR